MCMEISAITERWKLREGVSEKHSACLTSRLRPEQWNGAERADGRAEGTDWHQAREKSPWDRTNRDAMTRDYITTCSGQTDKSSLLVLWILPATGDNDIKYKLVFKLFKSGNCTWFACPTEELYVSKFWAVGFFFFFLLFFEHWVFRCNVCEARHNSWRWGDMGLILELCEFHVVFWEKLTSFYYGIQVIMKNGKTIGQKDLGSQTLGLSCTSCVNVGKWLNFSDPCKKWGQSNFYNRIRAQWSKCMIPEEIRLLWITCESFL